MKNRKQPEIRFANYTDEWKMQALKHVANRVTRKNKELKTQLPLTISAQYGLVDQVTYFNKQVASKDMSNYYLLERGEFAYNKSYSRDYPWGAIKRLDSYDMGALSSLYITFKPFKINSDFLLSYYDTNKWHKEVSTRATEGARNHGLLNISANDFLETELAIPLEEEQERIGSFFKQLDEAIFLHQQELDTMKKTKQGLLQKMFPKEGGFLPELRFPGFSGIWEESKFFDNIYNTIDFRGRTPKKLGLEWSASGYLALSALNVKNGYINPSVDAHYADEELYQKWMGGNELKEGQVLFTTEAPMGNVAQVPDDKGYILSQRTIAFEVNENKITNDFLGVLLRSPQVFNELSSLASGGTAKGVSRKSLSQLKVKVPVILSEQIQIGDFFKKLDRVIVLHEQELDSLKQTKKAFLQKMFV